MLRLLIKLIGKNKILPIKVIFARSPKIALKLPFGRWTFKNHRQISSRIISTSIHQTKAKQLFSGVFWQKPVSKNHGLGDAPANGRYNAVHCPVGPLALVLLYSHKSVLRYKLTEQWLCIIPSTGGGSPSQWLLDTGLFQKTLEWMFSVQCTYIDVNYSTRLWSPVPMP